MTYSKKTIAEAILILEIRGSDPQRWCMLVTSAAGHQLANDAWYAVILSPDSDIGEEALEAAARLREGSLPGTPGWER